MAVYTLSFDISGIFLTNAPVLHVWYGGVKINQTVSSLTSTNVEVQIDTDNDFNHNELRFKFHDNSSEPLRTLTISNIQINGSNLDINGFFGTDFELLPTAIVLQNYEFASYLTTGEIAETAGLKPPIQGTTGNDKLHGDYLGELINGQEGHDSIYGAGGNDDIYGGDGEDTIAGEDGDDRIYGGNDNDKVLGGDGNDRIEGNSGNDRLEGNNGDDTIYGGTGNDTIVGGDGNDTIFGEDGNDFITGGAGDDNINGGNGLNKIYAGDGNDIITGGADRDIVAGNAGADQIYGGAGDDHLDGGSENDIIFGEDGDDRLYGNTGNDTLRGGNGNDYIAGNDGADTILGDAGEDSINGGNDNDTINGGADNDILAGGDGNDRVDGDAGDDIIIGNLGTDILIGDGGNDIIYGGGLDSFDAYTIAQEDADVFYNNDTQSFYKIITTTEQWDNASIIASTHTLNGVSGQLLSIETAFENDFIQAELSNLGVTSTWLNSNDTSVEGQWTWGGGYMSGSTFFDSGTAEPLIYSNFAGGQHSTDNQDYLLMNSLGTWQDEDNGAQSAYVIEWNYEDLIPDNSADQIFGGSGDDIIFGSGGQDTIKGDGGADLIYGGAGIDTISGNDGNDVIYGGDGADTLNGGSGADILFGGAGNDRIFFDMTDIVDGGDNFDTLQLEANLSGNLDISNLTSIEHIALDNYQGNAAANTLTLSYADVNSLSSSGTLYITADLGLDIVTVTDMDANNDYAGISVVNGVVYERYSNGTENIYLELGIVTANQAFLIDPVTVTSLNNDVDINTGSYLAKTTGLSFETGGDINTTQVLYEQGGGTRGLNFYIDGGDLHIAAWNFAEENWGYKEVTVSIEANTRYTTSMVFDGAFPANGTIEGFLNGVSVGTATGVGNLYAHSGGIEIGGNDNTVINGSSNNNALTFSGTIQKAGQYNLVLSGTALDGFHDFLESGWLIDPGTNNAPSAQDDVVTVTSNDIETIDVLLNDIDIDGHTLSIESVGTAANGSVVLNGDGTITYQSNLGFSGTDSFTYVVTDGVDTDTATVTITVEAAAITTINDPTEISGLSVWYDTNDAASYNDVGGDLILEGINDKSGNNIDATQGTASAKPNVVNISGNSWMEFDGNDILVMPDSNLLNTGGPFNGKTISISFMTGSDINTRQVIYEQGGSTRGLNVFLDGGDLYLNGWNLAETQWGPAFANASVTANTAYVATMVYDGVAGTMIGYLNGTTIGTVSGLDLLYAHADDIALGGINGSTYFFTNGSGGNNFTGHIGEVAIYNEAVSSDDRTSLDLYMMDNWMPTPSAMMSQSVEQDNGAPENTGQLGMTLMGNIADDVISGHENNDMIYGDDGFDKLFGGGGDDEINGGNGDDSLWGDAKSDTGNNGNDTLNGDAGRDYLYGGGGDDVLLFGEGADYLFGQDGADIFKAYNPTGNDSDMAFARDFSAEEGDRIDISNLLTGFNDQHDDITAFVNVAQGNHTTIQVDRDGSGSDFNWDNILRLYGNTTLETDVPKLINDGILIV